MPAQAPIYRFGPYELRPRTQELYKQGTKLRLRPQPYRVLSVLLERAGDVVTRRELRELLWSAETFVDFEHCLNTSIKELRGVLGDSAGEHRYIETLPRLGYRMTVNVEAGATAAENHVITQPQAKVAENVPGQITIPNRPVRIWGVWQWLILVGISIVLILATSTYFRWSRSRAATPPLSGRLMLAVLPFQNLTGDSGQDYFSDGMTEEMIARLGSLDPQHLRVIARTSVMQYKNGREQVQQIGRELGVQYVLEGSVRRDAGEVRITAQLIETKGQSRVWARQYDRELNSLLLLQGEIAREIAGEIQIALDDHKRIAEPARPSLSPNAVEAYDLYLKGRYFWNKRTKQGFQQAIECFQQAIAKDAKDARAYAGLADAYAMVSSYGFAPQDELMPKARAAAHKALELDEGLAEAHTSLALITENYDWDWKTAEKEYRRAIELDPNYVTAHHWYAEYLGFQGRFDEALAESEQARQLDPLSVIIAADNGAILYFARQYDRAIKQLCGVLDMEPNNQRASIVLYAYAQKGQTANALAEIKKLRHGEETPWTWAMEAYVYGRAGQQAEARRALARLQQASRQRNWNMASMFALAYIGTNERDKAIHWLEKCYAEQGIAATSFKVDPIYDPLRADPRFQDLVRRVGLAQ
jgi:TolB-like protein/DNA-binding winged helix-turn-helix (wHTH) protein/Tfp pilus assembly protein PilF